MFAVYSSPFAAKALSLHGNRMKLLRRNHQRQQYVDTLATRNAANYHNNLIMHRHRMRQLYSPICEHETRHSHEIANHYKDWCRSRIGRRAKKRTKRMVNARAADSCLPQRETLQIPCFDYPRYYLLCVWEISCRKPSKCSFSASIGTCNHPIRTHCNLSSLISVLIQWIIDIRTRLDLRRAEYMMSRRGSNAGGVSVTKEFAYRE